MTPPPATRRHALVTCAFVGVTALVCAALLTAAALVPAPPAALPVLVIVCIGCPMMAACELPGALARLRAPRAVDALRRQLDALPETQHPLGL
jgi:hypothetical protein